MMMTKPLLHPRETSSVYQCENGGKDENNSSANETERNYLREFRRI